MRQGGKEEHEIQLHTTRSGKQLHAMMESLRIEADSDDNSAIFPKCGHMYPDDGVF